jgi:hypothetical protein
LRAQLRFFLCSYTPRAQSTSKKAGPQTRFRSQALLVVMETMVLQAAQVVLVVLVLVGNTVI